MGFSTNGNGTDTTMLVTPAANGWGGGYGVPYGIPFAGNYGGGFGNGFGGDWIALLFLLPFLMMFGGGWGGFGGMNGFGSGFGALPWLFASQANGDNNTQAGFNQAATSGAINALSAAVNSGFGDTALGIAGVNQNICSTGGQITAAVRDSAAQAEIAAGGRHNALTQQLYNNELASLNRSFAEQTANAQAMNGLSGQLAQCCCDNRLATCQTQNIIQAEAAANRAAGAANTQAVLDKLCQLELDGVKQNYEARLANEAARNQQLVAENQALRFDRSQVAQTAQLRTGMSTTAGEVLNELRSCPIPSQPVYGSQPIFQYPQTACGCPNYNGWAA